MVRQPSEEDERLFAFRRARARIPRPRISWCPNTRRYVLSRDGRRHTCGRNWKMDEAFRYLSDAMDEALLSYRERVQDLARNYGQPLE